MEKQKCTGCEIRREPVQFIYNSKTNKTCIICCEKRKKRYKKESAEPAEPPAEPPAKPPAELTEPPAESKDKVIERKLCLTREFLHRAFFPVHKYNFHNALVDIRDRFSPSIDKDFSYLNCDYFHTSKY